MNFRTKQFLRKRFADYYQNFQLTLPHDFPRREWGFIFFDELPEVVMRRHKAFSRESEALDYIRGMVPAHAYHSAAYYEFPGAATMKEKKWQGADLIFDLDADHLPGKVHSYKGMLDNVKSETAKLLDFLLEDFGFSENNTRIVFSGGRGYHIHVHDPKVLTLESAERREIVDYLTGTGFDYDSVLSKQRKTIKIHDGAKHHPMDHEIIYEMKKMSTWGKRVANETIRFLEGIRLLEYENAIIELKKIEGITTPKAKNIIKNLQSFEYSIRLLEEIKDLKKTEKISNLKANQKAKDIISSSQSFNSSEKINEALLEVGLDLKNLIAFRETIIKTVAVNIEGNTDEPVTADIKRLIRMPNSLHGGSGMRVVPLSLSEFRDFDPLNDAVVFAEKMIEIEVISRLKPQFSNIEMKGKSFTVSEGKNSLPEYAAIYLMCRGAAEYA